MLYTSVAPSVMITCNFMCDYICEQRIGLGIFFISVSSWDAGVSDYSILDNVMFLL